MLKSQPSFQSQIPKPFTTKHNFNMSNRGYDDAPSGEIQDDSYATGRGNTSSSGPVPVQSDNAKVEDPIDANTADSDAQLERDDNEAIDKGNIMNERTRGAKPATNYREPGDDEGLPGPDDGRSAVAQ
ncbi:hypothetical protein HJFPF1_02642 [Paramyrothecium foliicola]|nr:hypothetical protein HJFPF1_02642 [Paramyrothecium foliicola]